MTVEPGRCPDCGSDDVSYGDISWLADGELQQEAYCGQCGCCFTEYFSTTYLETSVQEHGHKETTNEDQ